MTLVIIAGIATVLVLAFVSASQQRQQQVVAGLTILQAIIGLTFFALVGIILFALITS